MSEAIEHLISAVLEECRDRLLRSGRPPAWEKRGRHGDPEVVTGMDVWVESHIVARLTEAVSGWTFFSEESGGDERDLRTGRCFVIDPIDGTREFLKGEDTFAISVAALDDGQVVAGVVDFPKRGVQYRARRAHGAYVGATRLSVADRKTIDGARLAVTPRQRRHEDLQLVFRPLEERSTLVDLRPITAKLAALADAEVDGALYLRHRDSRVCVWDYAAAALVVEEAGGEFRNLRTGARLLDEMPVVHEDGWVAGGAGTCEELRVAAGAGG